MDLYPTTLRLKMRLQNRVEVLQAMSRVAQISTKLKADWNQRGSITHQTNNGVKKGMHIQSLRGINGIL